MVNKTLYIELDTDINEAVNVKQPDRLLPHADAKIFRTKKEDRKKYKLPREKN